MQDKFCRIPQLLRQLNTLSPSLRRCRDPSRRYQVRTHVLLHVCLHLGGCGRKDRGVRTLGWIQQVKREEEADDRPKDRDAVRRVVVVSLGVDSSRMDGRDGDRSVWMRGCKGFLQPLEVEEVRELRSS